jgi:glycosyltransferase involved in cell wall biosynthesis
MKISVAMTTFNGARYLGEQLDSILAQERLPDEVIVCDDGSTDATVELLRDYASRSPCPMTVVVNEERLGSTKNFEQAIGLCSGDIIALCDQDDVWRGPKLAVIESAFDADPELGVVLSNADLIDENGVTLRRDLWTRARLNKRRQRALNNSRRYDLLFGMPFATGAAMAFRARFKPLVLPIPTEAPSFIHDRWIAVAIAAVGRIALIPDKLIGYRIHSQQQLGVGKIWFPLRVFIPHRCRSDSIALAAFDERLRDYADWPISPDFRASLAQRRRHIEARKNFSRNPVRRLKQVVLEQRSGRYTRYPYGWAVIVQDLIVGTR